MQVSPPHLGKHRSMGFEICGGIVNQITKNPHPLS